MNSITLRRVLPNVFRGMETTERIRSSEVWLNSELTFTRGCRICIQAESGSGKSSLFSFIYGNRTDYEGTITFDNLDIRTFDINSLCNIRTRELALMPQEMRLFPELTVMQNIQLKNDLTHHKSPAEIETLLERLDIAPKRDTPAALLSIGQQQRVAFVRALCQPFSFLMLDEPVSHLDRANNLTMARIAEEEATGQGAGIISTSVGNHLLLSSPQFISL